MIKAQVPAADKDGANLASLENKKKDFAWKKEAHSLQIPLSGPFNIYTESIGKWAKDPEKRECAAILHDSNGKVEKISFARLDTISRSWAGLFLASGLGANDRLLVMLPVCPEVHFAMGACAFSGIVFCPVFASAAYHELEYLIEKTDPAAILTRPDLAEKIPPQLVSDRIKVFYTADPPGFFSGEISMMQAAGASDTPDHPAGTTTDSPLYLIHTSGSTRPPKGIVHVHGDAAGILASAKWVLDLKENDVLFTDADPAWVTGTVYGAYAPWLAGVTTLLAQDTRLASSCYRVIEKNRVTVFYTTPKRLRDLMEAGNDLPGRYDLSSLRHIASVGAPLVPDLFYWTKQNLNLSPHDTWWMTETGIICIANFRSCDIKPGSIGKALPGIDAAIISPGGERLPSMTIGQLAIKGDWPGRMAAIFNDPSRYNAYFDKGWFLTGDIALTDEQGYFYHQGRTDDLIKTGGSKLVGPFEIEQILHSHPAISEAAVISKPSPPDTGVSRIKAFVVTKKEIQPSHRLLYQIRAFLKGNLPEDIEVAEIAFMKSLPKTRTGKLLRRVLRAWELGLPSGDFSKLSEQ